MPGFEGFADADGRFFRALAKNNNKDWFAAHKAEFEEGWNAPMKLLLADVKQAIDGAYAHCDLEEPKVFRIFRDVRFSKDKSPYKTHIGGYVPVRCGGRKATDMPMALYLHVGAREIFGAAGHYMMQPEALERFRAAVANPSRGSELDEIVRKLARKGFAVGSHEQLKRVPKGYDPGHPRADLLKRKGLFVTFPNGSKGLPATPKLTKWLVDTCKASAPFVEWLAFATA